jgi:hypothetical protein
MKARGTAKASQLPRARALGASADPITSVTALAYSVRCDGGARHHREPPSTMGGVRGYQGYVGAWVRGGERMCVRERRSVGVR